jgi:hypothetical protein
MLRTIAAVGPRLLELQGRCPALLFALGFGRKPDASALRTFILARSKRDLKDPTGMLTSRATELLHWASPGQPQLLSPLPYG